MPSFSGGPLDSQVGYDPSMDPPAEQLAAGAQQGGGESAMSTVDRIMQGAMELAMSDGQVTEDEKLIMQQITTLLQKLKTNRKKQVDQAIAGSPSSPAVGQAYAG